MPEETVQVEELLRAPRLAGDYGALQTALNDWLGESAPAEISAAGRPAVALCAAGFRRRRQTGRSGVLHHGPHLQCMRCFLTQEQRGCLAGEQTVEGLADSVDNVGWLSFRRAARPSSSWAMRLRRMTTIWPFTPTRTARCRPSSSRLMSSTSWRTSPAAAAKTLS